MQVHEYTARRAWRLLIPIFAAIILFCPALMSQKPPDKPVILKIRVEDGKITADISDAPLHSVLKELAERTGIVFEVRSQDNPITSVHLSQVSPEEAIQRIASRSDVVFYYGEEGGARRITMASIVPRASRTLQPGLSYLGTGQITKLNNAVETPEQALQILGTDASIEDRQTGIALLVKAKSEAGIKAIMDCLSDPAAEIRISAIDGLAALEAHAALPGIVKNLKDSNPSVRLSAVHAVTLLGDSSNVRDLRALSFDKDPAVASAAEMGIRKLSTIPKR